MTVIDIATPRVFLPLLEPSRYKGAHGGRGCVHPDTLIDTPDGQIKISEFEGGNIYSHSGDGVIEAYCTNPIKYAKEALFSVVLENGAEIICTDQHRFLTDDGWMMLKEISLSSSVCVIDQGQLVHHQTSSVLSRLGLLSDVRHCFRRLLGFLYCYSLDCHLYGGQPLSAAETYLDALQQLAGEWQHNSHALTNLDVRDTFCKRSLSLSLHHLSSLASLLQEVVKNYQEQENCNAGISFVLLSVSSLLLQLSHEKNNHQQLICKLSKLLLGFVRGEYSEKIPQIVRDISLSCVDDSSFSDSISCNHAHHNKLVGVKSIEFHSCDHYYDFFVPIYNNYLSNGIVNHNSGKSHFFAELLVEHSLAEKGLRSVCIREVQKSLKDSAKTLIEDKIAKWPNCGFKSYNDRIETPGDGLIIFNGMKDHNAESIKSLEGIKRCWIEEARTITANSLTLLRPTIREEGSEIWASWNPVREQDPIDQLLRGSLRPKNSIVVKANWSDNPFFPSVLEEERLECLNNDPDMYDHIWEGGYATMNKGAYYAAALTLARSEGRIGKVAADPLMTTYAVWDIGGTGAKADAVAIWIVQFIGKEIRILDYYEAKGQELSCHVGWLRDNDYDRAHCILPHDGVQHDKVYDVTYESALISAGFKVDVIKNQGQGAAMARVQAARRLFPSMWFNEEKTKAGVEALSWYHEKLDPVRQIGLGPDHDWSSNGADAFGLIAIAHSQLGRTATPRRPFQQQAMP